MIIEPYAARTVCIRPVMPPKPAPRVLAPTLSMHDDAKQVNLRFAKINGGGQDIGMGRISNAIRIAVAAERRAGTIAAILALLQGREFSRSEIMDRLNLTDNQSSEVLKDLKAEGKVTYRKGAGCVAYWTAT